MIHSLTTQRKPAPEIDPYYSTESWKQKRLYVMRRDKGRCRYCGNIGAFMADHVIPRKKGGSDKVKNLVLCCGRCNKLAGNKVFASFDEKRQWIRENLPQRFVRPD